MTATIEERRRPLPSVASVYRPIEEYWETYQPVGSPELAALPEALEPLDAFLIHRLLDLISGRPLLVDAAIGGTGGASSLIGAHHPRARGVWAVADAKSASARRALAALRQHLDACESRTAPLTTVMTEELSENLAGHAGTVVLVDSRGVESAALAREIGLWLDASPDAVVLVLGVGRVGECPAIESLLSLCSPRSGRRFRLLRELGETLMSSRLGLVTRDDHPDIELALGRLEQLYTGNYRYLDLLWRANHAALREANIDTEVLRSHPTFGAISEEIEGLRRAVREANERADLAALAASEVSAGHVRIFPEAAAPPASPLIKLRRRLAPTPVGQAWRLAKRARVRLSPTPVGRAYRLTKRFALTWVGRRGR